MFFITIRKTVKTMFHKGVFLNKKNDMKFQDLKVGDEFTFCDDTDNKRFTVQVKDDVRICYTRNNSQWPPACISIAKAKEFMERPVNLINPSEHLN